VGGGRGGGLWLGKGWWVGVGLGWVGLGTEGVGGMDVVSGWVGGMRRGRVCGSWGLERIISEIYINTTDALRGRFYSRSSYPPDPTPRLNFLANLPRSSLSSTPFPLTPKSQTPPPSLNSFHKKLQAIPASPFLVHSNYIRCRRTKVGREFLLQAEKHGD